MVCDVKIICFRLAALLPTTTPTTTIYHMYLLAFIVDDACNGYHMAHQLVPLFWITILQDYCYASISNKIPIIL